MATAIPEGMNPNDIQVGDGVRLKSGDVKMTVRSIEQEFPNPLRSYGEDGPPFVARWEWHKGSTPQSNDYLLTSLVRVDRGVE